MTSETRRERRGLALSDKRKASVSFRRRPVEGTRSKSTKSVWTALSEAPFCCVVGGSGGCWVDWCVCLHHHYYDGVWSMYTHTDTRTYLLDVHRVGQQRRQPAEAEALPVFRRAVQDVLEGALQPGGLVRHEPAGDVGVGLCGGGWLFIWGGWWWCSGVWWDLGWGGLGGWAGVCGGGWGVGWVRWGRGRLGWRRCYPPDDNTTPPSTQSNATSNNAHAPSTTL